jgi:hypothetical protein
MTLVVRTLASALVALAASQAHAALLSDLKVVQDNLKPGLWRMEAEPYKVKGQFVTPPASQGCATVEQILDKLALPISYRTGTREQTPEAPTVITKDLADHGAVEVTLPPEPAIGFKGIRRTIDVKKTGDNQFVMIAGPGKLTTVRLSYLGKCVP